MSAGLRPAPAIDAVCATCELVAIVKSQNAKLAVAWAQLDDLRRELRQAADRIDAGLRPTKTEAR